MTGSRTEWRGRRVCGLLTKQQTTAAFLGRRFFYTGPWLLFSVVAAMDPGIRLPVVFRWLFAWVIFSRRGCLPRAF
jgi:hypothetical protein